MTPEDRPTAAQQGEERCRVLLPVINTDHMVFSVKLSVKWAEFPVEARNMLHDRFVTFANDQQLFIDKVPKR